MKDTFFHAFNNQVNEKQKGAEYGNVSVIIYYNLQTNKYIKTKKKK